MSDWHTQAQVDNLISNYQGFITSLGKYYAATRPAWDAQDSAASQDFDSDLLALQDRFEAAQVTSTPVTVLGIPAGQHQTSSEEEYQAIVHAIRAGGEGAPLQKGDFSDLVGRLAKAQLSLGVSATGLPTPIQPPKGSDTLNDWRNALEPFDVIDKAKDDGTSQNKFPLWVKLAAGVVGVVVVADSLGVASWARAYEHHKAGRKTE
jgi:hypothetical protein